MKCVAVKPKHPRDDYDAALEHIWAYMRERAARPHGTVQGMDTFEFAGSLPDVIRQVWPGVKARDATSMAAYVGTRLKLTQRVGVIESGTRYRLQRWWVADTYRPSEPAPEPAPIATPATAPTLVTRETSAPQPTPAPVAAPVDAQRPVPQGMGRLLDDLLDVARAQLAAEGAGRDEQLKAQNAQLREEIAALRSENDAYRKFVKEFVDKLGGLQDEGRTVLELTA